MCDSGGVGGVLDTLAGVLSPIYEPIKDIISGAPFGEILGDFGKLGLSTATGGLAGPLAGGLNEIFSGAADVAGGVPGLGGDVASGLGGGTALAAASPFGEIAAEALPTVLGEGGSALGPLVSGGAEGIGSSLPFGIENIGQAEGLGLPLGIGDSIAPTATSAGALADPLATGANSLGGGLAEGAAADAAGGSAPALTGTPGVLDPAISPSATAREYITSGGAAGPLGATANAGLFDPGGPLAGIKDFIKDNKSLIGPGLLAGTVGKQLLFPPSIPGKGQLDANAGLAGNIAQKFAGGLTPEQQAASAQQLKGQIAAIKSKYASLGMSGSTAEQQDIQNAQNRASASQAGAVSQNANTALGAIGVSNQPILAVANQQLADDTALSNAIARAAAVGMYGLAA